MLSFLLLVQTLKVVNKRLIGQYGNLNLVSHLPECHGRLLHMRLHTFFCVWYPLGKELWIEPLYWLLIVNLLQNSTVPDSSRPDECEAAGRGFVPPPFLPVRAPLFPVDPRSQFVRRAPPPFPPPPPGNIYAAPRDYFPPRDFAGPPPPLFPGRLFKKFIYVSTFICAFLQLCFLLLW